HQAAILVEINRLRCIPCLRIHRCHQFERVKIARVNQEVSVKLYCDSIRLVKMGLAWNINLFSIG
ncbi:MAG TPA: hypothetical protein VGR40_00840, partial [Candidatus Binatus sp.]|nr:hypothetical protein [Candidatus Binatus sp.]